VCLAVGYTSLGSFSATFKRTVGLAPSVWREQVREQALVGRVPSCFRREWGRPAPKPSRNREADAPGLG
jgi:AraC-like DNA-binding protein